jgi:hypothetical protein
MTERFRVLNTCLIFDLITKEAVETKSGLYFINPLATEIDEVSIVSGNLCVRRGRDRYITKYTVVSTPSPVSSFATSPEPEAEEVAEVDQIPFLPFPLILDDDSTTPSPVASKRKGRKGKKN